MYRQRSVTQFQLPDQRGNAQSIASDCVASVSNTLCGTVTLQLLDQRRNAQSMASDNCANARNTVERLRFSC